ncbi:MAG: porin [Pseudomonadota bacterium]
MFKRLGAVLLSTTTINAVSAVQANAADAVVIEPEPVEYVRVCDAYGAGFFFIPGTETCIRLGGFVRSSYEKVHLDGQLASGAALAEDNLTAWTNRGRLNVDTRNETEFGTLRALYRLEGGDSNTDADVDMDIALISLAGFRAGFAGSTYWSSNTDWVNFSAIGGLGPGGLIDEGWLSFSDATIFDYTFAFENLTVTVGVEDPRIDFSQVTIGGAEGGNATNNGGTAGEVNFYAGFNYAGEIATIAFTAVHDSLATESTTLIAAGSAAEGGWAYRGNIAINLESFVPGGKLVGQYSYDGNYRTAYVHTDGVTFDPEAIWGLAFEANLTDELQFVSQYMKAEADPDEGEGDAHIAGVGLNWFPDAAPGFSLRASYFFGEVEDSLGFNAVGATVAAADRASYDFDGFFVGVRRDF